MLVRLNNYRLNGLALANIHKDIPIEISELVDTFVSTKPRHMVMSGWSGDELNVRLLLVITMSQIHTIYFDFLNLKKM